MKLLHNIGPRIHSNYNEPDEIIACNDDLSFDGIYRNVFLNADVLVKWRERNPTRELIFFVQSYNIGGDNSMDYGAPKLEDMCTWEEILFMARSLKAEIGFHSVSHPDLTQVYSFKTLMEEMRPPFPMKSFAYPYGKSNDQVRQIAKLLGYERAYGVFSPPGDVYNLPRSYLNW